MLGLKVSVNMEIVLSVLELHVAEATEPCEAVSEPLARCLDFFRAIGLPWAWKRGANGFLDGVEVERGALLIDPCASASNILHEAGHLAIMPGRFRVNASGDLSAAMEQMFGEVDFTDPDSGIARAAIQCGDAEATAWAWAVGVHLRLPPRTVIKDAEYDGTGAFLRTSLRVGAYAGINGLSHAGFCAVRPGSYATARGLPVYPQLAMWLQQA